MLTIAIAYFVAARTPRSGRSSLRSSESASANALNAPAFQSSMPLLVHRQDLPGAISLNSAMINGTRVIGPVLAAVLAVAGLSVSSIFLVNAATYLFFIAALLIVRMPDVRSGNTTRGFRSLTIGLNIARQRLVLNRLLLGMFLFSLFSLVYIGLFPSVARLNFDIAPSSATYRWLYATWGAGAFLGALSVGTFLSSIDRKVLIVRGFTGFAVALGVFSQVRGPELAFPVGFVLGFFYFMMATAITTTFQLNMKNTERATVMPLWFMVFGGTVPIGNLLFGVVIEWVGARAVLGFGAAFALFLAWWVDLRRLPQSAFLSERGRRRAVHSHERDPPALNQRASNSATIRSRPADRLALTSTTLSGPSGPSAAATSSTARSRRVRSRRPAVRRSEAAGVARRSRR